MRIAFNMAFKNLIGAGLRTWLNVSVLAFCFIVIVFYNGFLNGWQEQGKKDAMDWEFGYGQVYHADYDPYNVFTLPDAHGIMSKDKQENLLPILLQQGTVYPDGRMIPITIKGINPEQNLLKLPTHLLSESKAQIPVIIGDRFASGGSIKEGDELLLRWKDKNGMYDATNVTIAGIFYTNAVGVDNGQIWMSLQTLQKMTGLENEATLYIANSQYQPKKMENWKFQNLDVLLSDFKAAVQAERIGSIVIYLVLLSIGLLAIFDTQVLSIFRRQREIGTYIALGMTRFQVLKIFTVEGAMYSVFAAITGLVLGAPLFIYTAHTGISLGVNASEMGFRLADIIYPIYGISLIVGTLS
jgi:putative ABC transport system permease protein